MRRSVAKMTTGLCLGLGVVASCGDYEQGASGVGDDPVLQAPLSITDRIKAGRGRGTWADLGPITVMPEGTRPHLALAMPDPAGKPGSDERPEGNPSTNGVMRPS